MAIKLDTKIEFFDPDLKAEFDRFVEEAEPIIEMAKKIANHQFIQMHDFFDEDIIRIEEYVNSMVNGFEGEVLESGWFYLKEEEDIVYWIKSNTGFIFNTVYYHDID